MASESEYVLMAGAVYISTRAKINQLSAPNGWEKVTMPQDSYVSDPGSGFEAIAFYNTANPNEIVIAYAGTDPSDITGDWLANGGLATGAGSDQLVRAAEYYLAVKAANPDASITLTGHSLGGHGRHETSACLRRAA